MGELVKFNLGAAAVEMPAAAVLQLLINSVESPIDLPALQHTKKFLIGKNYSDFGGVFAGELRDKDGSPYLLFAPAGDEAYKESVEWGGQGEEEPHAKCFYDGLANTIALCESKHKHPVAEWARSVEIDGFNDFYLPSRRELMLCFVNVPELFADGWYWTSTQYSAGHAYMQYFGGGGTNHYCKDYSGRARVVRRFVQPL